GETLRAKINAFLSAVVNITDVPSVVEVFVELAAVFNETPVADRVNAHKLRGAHRRPGNKIKNDQGADHGSGQKDLGDSVHFIRGCQIKLTILRSPHEKFWVRATGEHPPGERSPDLLPARTAFRVIFGTMRVPLFFVLI